MIDDCGPQVGCGCSCHTMPGVSHVVACCDTPPMRSDYWETFFVFFDTPCEGCGMKPDTIYKYHCTKCHRINCSRTEDLAEHMEQCT